MSLCVQVSALSSNRTGCADLTGSTYLDMCGGQTWPKISIITPSFNQGKYLEETILSVLNQNYPNIEYIIIDGGSTDNSVDIIKKYEKYLKYWVSEPDRGQSHAINKGFERATGDIFGWLNSDDYLLPDALRTIAKMFSDEPSAGVFIGAGQFVDEDGRTITTKLPTSDTSITSLFKWLDDFHFMQPSCFFTRDAWNICGPLDLCLHYSMDLDLWLKLAKKYKFACIPEILSSSRVHKTAKTTEYTNMSIVDSCIVLMRHGAESEARKHLELMAARLSWNEYYMNKVLSFPLFRLFRHAIKYFMKSDQKWRDVSSPWSSNG